MQDSNSHVLLELKNIKKSFPGVDALKGVSLKVKRGSVHALMGENGAGKSTLMKCLFGVYEKDGGEIFLNGKAVHFKNPKDALLGGVAMVHQELNQAGKLTVAENIFLGRFPKYLKYAPIIDVRRMIKDTKAIFDDLKLDISPKVTLDSLPIAKRQMAEIAKAYSYDAKIYVFDEPTSSLSSKEAEKLFGIIKMLKERGCGIIYISHKMEEILRISDEVTVMRDGAYITTKNSNEITTDDIIKLMVGKDVADRYPERGTPTAELLFEANDLSGEYSRLSSASLKLHKGEVLGIAGLDGAGRTELLEAIFGLSARKSGEMTLAGKKIYNKSPKEAIKNGFALVTEDRRESGIFSNLSVKENAVITSLSDYKNGPFISNRRAYDATYEYMKKINIKTPSANTLIRALSGGNQQKVIFSRWMLTYPTVLLLDEPTRGIDVMAKYEIYKLIHSLAREGRGVIMASSETAELIGICHRIIVMSGGKIAGELAVENATEESIIKLAYKYA